MNIFSVNFSVIFFLFFILYKSNNEIENYYKIKHTVKKIIPKDIYAKYFTNIKVIYRGSKLKKNKDIFYYAYVSFVTTNNNYFKLINGCIHSMHSNSKHPIVLYLTGKLTSNYKRIFRQYDKLLVYLITEEANVYFMKLRVALLAPVLVGQIVESDTIVLPGADCLFRRIKSEITKEYSFPILTRHNDIRSPIKGNGTTNILRYAMKNRSMRYMHAHMSWTYQSLIFIARVYVKSFLLKYSNDELALNYNLWESKAYKQWCMFDPSYKCINLTTNINNFNILKEFNNFIVFNFIHGCKSYSIQHAILLKLKEIKINKYKLIYFLNNKFYFSKDCAIKNNIQNYSKTIGCLI